jgi:monofunctional biosynthetic peptidoglycan transglycosylase
LKISYPCSSGKDYEQSAAEGWYPINDRVMGGTSKSEFQAENGIAVFRGLVSLENNGGFASVRSALGNHDLSAYAGIALRVWGMVKTL